MNKDEMFADIIKMVKKIYKIDKKNISYKELRNMHSDMKTEYNDFLEEQAQ